MVISFPRTSVFIDSVHDRIVEAFPRRTVSRRLHLWRMVTLPFWFGSDVPPPMLPTFDRAGLDIANEGPAAAWLSHMLRKLTMRFWISWCVSSTLRGAALGATGAMVWSLLAAVGLASSPSIWLITWFVLLGAIPGLAFGLINRPTPLRVAMMIDRTFDLDERLITAVDRHERVHNEIETMQRADAANALVTVLREIRPAQLMPVRECVLVMVAVTSALAVWMFAFDSRQVDALTDTRVPGYYPASERLADQQGALPRKQTPSAESNGGESVAPSGETTGSNQDLQDLGHLGKALDQHSTTKSAASAIASGDLPGAAAELDAAAANVANASQEERDALADDLDEAADSMSAENTDLAQQVRDTADAIREGGTTAEQGVKDLADAVEAESPPPPQEGAAGSDESGNSDTAPVGEQQPGAGGDQSSSSSAGSSGGNSSEPAASDPGAGSDAEPGIAEEPSSEQEGAAGDQPGSTGSSSGEGAPSGESEAPSGSDAAEGGESSGASNQDNSDTSTGSGSDAMGDPNDETSASQGSGAGSGQKDANDQPTEGQAPNTTESKPSDPASGEPTDVETGDPPEAPVGESGDGGTAGSGNQSIEIGGSSNVNVQSGNDVGSSSLGSGSSGADVASGDAESQPVGPAGPDSNHVPDSYEDIVDDYFSEPVP
jgi:hypothetical protein